MHSDMVFKCQSNYHLSASLLQSSVSHYPSEIILYADFVHSIHFFLLDFFFFWLHFILIVTLDVLLLISNFSTTCQVTLIRVL